LGAGTVDWTAIDPAVCGSDDLAHAIGHAILVTGLGLPEAPPQPEGGAIVRARPARHRPAHAAPRRLVHLPVARAIAIRHRAEHAGRAVRAAITGIQARKRVILASLLILLSIGGTVGLLTNFGRTPRAAYGQERSGGHAQSNAAAVSRSGAGSTAKLLPATAPPAPASPTLANSAPLRAHEIFGFAPYWTLSQSGGFNVSGLSTLAYFSIDVNADGSLDKSGAGWAGYQSQDLANLVTRAHGAGDRVVLTVNCFDQHSLDEVTSSPTAGSTLATALIAAVRAKNLDGVNLDFEGEGSGDQAGLTRLVTQVSTAVHAVNPHYQVTMDTYASSAGDPSGFYNIPALAPAVDGFFVMEYQLNLQSGASPVSPLTSTMFSDKTTIDQYAAAAPAAKVILGMPYFGIDWPTTNGTLSATATGPATDVTYGQVMASAHPVYWDATTDTAWTSYQVGNQWHETFFEDPTSLYDAAQLADASNLGGMGVWALGMDGNDPNLLAALAGFAPAVKDGAAGPSATTPSGPSAPPGASGPTAPTTASTATAPAAAAATEPNIPKTTTTTSPPATTTTTIGPRPLDYMGTWQGRSVALTLSPASKVLPPPSGAPFGHLTGFVTNDPSTSCLGSEASLNVWPLNSPPNQYLVVTRTPGDCVNAEFTFTYP
jgi:Glycosyl hydrolases family 18